MSWIIQACSKIWSWVQGNMVKVSTYCEKFCFNHTSGRPKNQKGSQKISNQILHLTTQEFGISIIFTKLYFTKESNLKNSCLPTP